MNHIELFAGCGGLSLGLKSLGFKMILANELSPMASETFAYNFFDEDLSASKISKAESPTKLKTKWLSSNFSTREIAKRLREDPRLFPKLNNGYSDVSDNQDINGSLIVGSIVQLNEWLSQNSAILNQLSDGFGQGGVDLVSGGPPCQSFSMAGMREFSNARNILPWEFAKFVSMVKPKFAILENVTGILRPFTVDGDKVYAWFEVAKAFAEIGYVPLCLHINAKLAGVAQNRPRFIMLLFRNDVYQGIKSTLNETERALLSSSEYFSQQIVAKLPVHYGDLEYFDVKNDNDLFLFKSSFLRPLVEYSAKPHNVRDAIHDLYAGKSKPSTYVKTINTYLGSLITKRRMQNHELRQNNALVKRRFRIYQVIQGTSRQTQNEVRAILSGLSKELSQASFSELREFDFFLEDGAFGKFKSSKTLIKFLLEHQTKKQTQKALDQMLPAPAALSIPDDACHYDSTELRTLTVREMARIQSFPDNFSFRSKVTTGGQSRKFEVPQYTQVGNAVPPLLGRALGKVVKELVERFNEAATAPEKFPVDMETIT
jgi:DNA (cytosine-5)-methyltransferase 1